MAATVINGKIERYADRTAVWVWIFENYGGWDIEAEWTMSTGCEVAEMAKIENGVTVREIIYIWP